MSRVLSWSSLWYDPVGGTEVPPCVCLIIMTLSLVVMSPLLWSVRICSPSGVYILSTGGSCGIMSSIFSLVCVLFSLGCGVRFGMGMFPHNE